MNRVLFSSQSDHWSSPVVIHSGLTNEFDLNFDPNPLLSKEDGRKVKWMGRVYCNPPYSRIGEFIRKGLFHLASKDCSILVYLLPARTDTAWFHDFCLHADEVRFIRGRLKFGNAKNSAPFPSMIVIFKKWELEKLLLEDIQISSSQANSNSP